MLMKRINLLLGLLFLSASAVWAGEQHYGASLHESQWEAAGNRMQCMLFHKVPAYGKATFIQRSGGQMFFSLKPRQNLPRVNQVQLTISSPSWKHNQADAQLWNIPITEGRAEIDLEGEFSLWLLDELAQGMLPVFKYLDPLNQKVLLQVKLSPVWLSPALKEFMSCVINLLPLSFEQVRYSQLQFDFGSSELLPKSLERAAQIIEFMQEETTGIRRVTIEGHTDDIGHYRYNAGLGKRRAEMVKAILMAEGIEENKIVLKSYGERRPNTSNRTMDGRAINRRVILTLSRK